MYGYIYITSKLKVTKSPIVILELHQLIIYQKKKKGPSR